jgi:hypothetical protein
MSNTAYDGTIESDFSFVFTPETGPAFGSEICQVEEHTPASATTNIAKFMPISGANTGIEQVVAGGKPTGEAKIKATYGKTEHLAAMVAWASRSKGTLVITYGDGLVYTYPLAILNSVTPGTVNASNVRTDDLTWTVTNNPTVA